MSFNSIPHDRSILPAYSDMVLGNGIVSTINKPLMDFQSSKTCGDGLPAMNLREQENQFHLLRKENFHLKLKIYFIEQMQNRQSSCDFLRENVDLKVTTEMLRVELQEKQQLICDVAVGMEQMELMHKTDVSQCQEKVIQLSQRISDLEHQIEELDRVRIPDKPLHLSVSSSTFQHISELERKIAKFEHELQEQTKLRTAIRAENILKSERIRELTLNNNQTMFNLEELQKLLAQKEELISSLEEFQNCAKSSFDKQIYRLSEENNSLNTTIQSLKNELSRFERVNSFSNRNRPIMSTKNQIVKDLNKSIETKKLSMHSLRSELLAAEHDLQMMRSQNDMLLNQLESPRYGFECGNSKSNCVLSAVSGLNSEIEKQSSACCEVHRSITSSNSESAVNRDVRDYGTNKLFNSYKTCSSTSTSSLLNGSNKSLQPMHFLTNPMFCRFRESHSQQISMCANHCIGTTIQLPASSTITIEDRAPKLKSSTSSIPNLNHSILPKKTDIDRHSIVGNGLKYLFDRMKHS